MNGTHSGPATLTGALPDGRMTGPMPWVIAIMIFLTVLATAAGIGLASGLDRMQAQLAGRLTVQLVEPDAAERKALANRVRAELAALPQVETASLVPDTELAEQVRPWLGEDLAAADLPVPALIELSMREEAVTAGTGAVRAVLDRLAPHARLDADAAFLQPLVRTMASLMGLAVLMVVLMMGATAAVVVMAARGAHAAHRGTIDILHLLGATDGQIAGLFQRRMALDALFGGMVGLGAALVTLLLMGLRLSAMRSELIRLAGLPLWGWVVLLLVPLLGALVALVTARWTVRARLEQAL